MPNETQRDTAVPAGEAGYYTSRYSGEEMDALLYYMALVRAGVGSGGDIGEEPAFKPFQGRIKFQSAAIYAVGESPFGDPIGEYKLGDVVTITELNSTGLMAHVEKGWIPSNAYTKIEET